VTQVDVSICLRRSADTKHNHIGRRENLFIERSSLEPPLGNVSFYKADQAGFEKWRLRLADCLNFIEVAVDPEYTVPNLGQACGAYAAHIPQAHHNYVLLAANTVTVQHDLVLEQFIIE
jgi:hypothetical protein